MSVAALSAAAAIAPVTLPNGWRLAPFTGTVVTVGTLPTGIVTSRDGKRAFVLETGYRKPALRILDSRSLSTLRVVEMSNAYGAPVLDPQGDGVWVAATSSFADQIAHIDTDAGRVDRTVSLPIPFVASALAFSPDGKTLAVAGDVANRVAFVDVATGTLSATVSTGRHPAALAYAPNGNRLFVADRAESQLDVIDTARAVVVARVAVGRHPAALAVDGRNVYVADSDDDDISVVSVENGANVRRVPLPFGSPAVIGSSPDALFFAGDRLYVACGAANAVAVFRRSNDGLTPLGAFPTGWYPTGVAAAADGALLVVNGKGEGGHANPDFRPNARASYVAGNLVGSVRRVDRPTEGELREQLATMRSLGPPGASRSPSRSSVVRPNGPIKHVIYV